MKLMPQEIIAHKRDGLALSQAEVEQFVSVRIDWRLVKKNIVIDSAYCSWLNIWKLISLVHLRFFFVKFF